VYYLGPASIDRRAAVDALEKRDVERALGRLPQLCVGVFLLMMIVCVCVCDDERRVWIFFDKCVCVCVMRVCVWYC